MTHADLMNAPTEGAFQKWPKMPRLFKDCTVTEKIDGTNACVLLIPDIAEPGPHLLRTVNGFHVYAQSRTRMITPADDNYGFAGWVAHNAEWLIEALGAGRHYGEWWGQGIQRNYGLKHRCFSLFNTGVYGESRELFESESNGTLSVVPVLYQGPFDTYMIHDTMRDLGYLGSTAAPGFMDPEGVAIFHHASRTVFKYTFEYDRPKGGPRDQHDNVTPLFRDASAYYAGDELVVA